MSLTAAPAGSLPRGAAKLLAIHWPLALLLAAVASVGFLMLYAAADGSFDPWARAQMIPAIARACGPDNRTMPTPPDPAGVAMATMVSVA